MLDGNKRIQVEVVDCSDKSLKLLEKDEVDDEEDEVDDEEEKEEKEEDEEEEKIIEKKKHDVHAIAAEIVEKKNDQQPTALHITERYLKGVVNEAIQEEFKKHEERMKKYFEELFQTNKINE